MLLWAFIILHSHCSIVLFFLFSILTVVEFCVFFILHSHCSDMACFIHSPFSPQYHSILSLYDYYKDKGYALNNDGILVDDEHAEDTDKNDEEYDPKQCNESDFDYEADDSDSDYSVI